MRFLKLRRTDFWRRCNSLQASFENVPEVGNTAVHTGVRRLLEGYPYVPAPDLIHQPQSYFKR